MNTTTTHDNTNALPVGQILIGDALSRLKELPDNCIDTVITSPPYYRLRDYGCPDQIGLEDTIDGWVVNLLNVLDQCARVLKETGSVWLNLGDSYSRHAKHGAVPKSLLLGPERLLLALSRRGWSIRNKVIWAKPNSMPASVQDRLSTTWEPLYLLVRSSRYFFDLDAIRIPPRTPSIPPSAVNPTSKYATTSGTRPDWAGPLAGTNSGLERMKADGRTAHPRGKNPGDVWTLPTAAYKGAHFATFPERLVERPLKATCPKRVCATCGTPWWPPSDIRHDGTTPRHLRKSCNCRSRAWTPGIVLDPFMGAGTVGVVATRLKRNWIGIELNPDYAELATQRIASTEPDVQARGAA